MKKLILILTLIFGSLYAATAQEDDENKRAEKIEALKIAFITKELNLSSAEAQQFWPVYGQYENDMRSLLKNRGNNDVIDNEEKLLNIRKRYRPEFIKVLGQPRVNKLFNSEREFRKLLFQHLKNRNDQQRPMMRRR